MSDVDPPQRAEDRDQTVPPPPPDPPPPSTPAPPAIPGSEHPPSGPWAPPYASTFGSGGAPPPPGWGAPPDDAGGAASAWSQPSGARWPQQPQQPGWPPPSTAGWPQEQAGWPQQQGPSGAGFGPPLRNPSATASLVLGIIGIVTFWAVGIGVVLGILAVIFGGVGMSRSNALPERFQRGRAKAGIITGVAAIVLGVAFLVVVVVAFDDVDSDPANGICNEDRFLQDPDC